MYRSVKKDIERLVQYGKSLGFETKFVKIKEYNGDAGYFNWYPPNDIEILIDKKSTSTEILLVLLHELGHARDFIALGRPKKDKLPRVLGIEHDGMSRRRREELYALESRAINNMFDIWQELGLKLPLWRLRAEQEFDRWMYMTFLKTGTFPSRELIKAKHQGLVRKYNRER